MFSVQGVKAVISESFERIHRSNLVGMGIMPLEYLPGENAESLGLTGEESYTIEVPEDLKTGQTVDIKVEKQTKKLSVALSTSRNSRLKICMLNLDMKE